MTETEMLKEPRIIVAKVAHADQASGRCAGATTTPGWRGCPVPTVSPRSTGQPAIVQICRRENSIRTQSPTSLPQRR